MRQRITTSAVIVLTSFTTKLVYFCLDKMVDSLFIFKKCLYYFGLLPNYNEKTHKFTPNKSKAAFAFISFTVAVSISTYFIQNRTGYYRGEFKIVCDWVMYLTITSWMVFNNTNRADKLTSITEILLDTKIPLKKYTLLTLLYNIKFFLVLLTLNGYHLMMDAEINWQLLPIVIDMYTSQCISFMYSTKFFLIVLLTCRWIKMNKNLEGFLDVLPAQPQQVSRIITEHNLLNNLVDMYNDVFGFESLLVKLYELVNLLAVLNFLLDRKASENITVMLFAWAAYVCVSIVSSKWCTTEKPLLISEYGISASIFMWAFG